MPDIDSLPPSYSPSRVNGTDNRHSPSPRASSSSLAAAATINAGIQNEGSRGSSTTSTRDRGTVSSQFGQNERRRSNAFLSSYDPALPGPGELQTGDLRLQTDNIRPSSFSFAHRNSSPHGFGSPIYQPQYRDRTPSLGEIHQQLEQEQEAQTNRLLDMIRHQQAELQAIRDQAASASRIGISATGEITPPIERPVSYAYPPSNQPSNFPTGTMVPSPPVVRGTLELSRRSSRRSRTPSRATSPSLHLSSSGMYAPGDDVFYGGRSQPMMDENAFYQAETQMLTRENQMLRQRIRELERMLNDGNNSTTTNSPVVGSNLSGPPLEAENTEAVLAHENAEKED